MKIEVEIKELLTKKATHRRAFELILTNYKERLYFLIRKIVISHDDTDDVLQEAFIKIWKNLEKFRGDSNLYTWLYRIATNEALTFLRRRKNIQNISIDDNPELINLTNGNRNLKWGRSDEMFIPVICTFRRP